MSKYFNILRMAGRKTGVDTEQQVQPYLYVETPFLEMPPPAQVVHDVDGCVVDNTSADDVGDEHDRVVIVDMC